ncbi:hypothetical protein MC885_004865 [Smutsia gigantea]|nr:hypothetical protein MC885_004865 [Smutsia gigantea]
MDEAFWFLFPVHGATCGKEPIPPGAAGAPCASITYSSQRNWPPGFITAVRSSCAGENRSLEVDEQASSLPGRRA